MMETNTTFVRANGIVKLYTITQVGLYFAIIIYPSDTECENTIRFYQSFHNFCLFEFRMLVVYIFDTHKYFVNGLQVL